tara:strand:+ start:274 stop:477 length:204 start_codon:yes stop_codon:yes gene_type:complete
MQLEVVIYISISYLATHRRVSRNNAQAKNFIKKGTGEDTGDKIFVKFSKKQEAMLSLEITLYYFILE